MTWISVAVGGTSAAIAGVQYLNNKKNQKRDEKNRPQYTIPDEISKNLSSAENYAAQTALQGIPEEQKQQYISNLQRNASYGLNQLGTRKAGVAGVAAVNENMNQGYSNLLAQDANAKIQNQRYGQQLVSGARQNMADYKGQEFQLNKSNPYYENIARRDANNGALAQNLSKSMQLGANMYGGLKSTPAAAPENINGGQVGSVDMPYGYNNFQANPATVDPNNNLQNPNLFNDSGVNSNPYANGNIGTYNNPNTGNMFMRPNANPNYPL
jgi:hypothetical protein